MDFDELAQRILSLVAQRDVSRVMAQDERYRSALGAFFVYPSRAQLTQVLREAFFATLLTDEARPIRFVMTFMPTEVPPQTASAQLDLEPRLPVTRSAIRRIAPTAPPERAILRLHLGDNGVQIASILTFADHFGRPVGLSVAGLRPGVLSVSFNNQKILHLAGDEVTALDGAANHFDVDQAMTRLAMHQHEGSYQARMIVTSILWDAAAMMKRNGHGGAFWIMPSAGTPFEGQVQRLTSHGSLFEPVASALVRAGVGMVSFRDFRSATAEALIQDAESGGISHTLLQLAATDGAVLLSLEPRLLGFGAFVHAPPPDRIRLRREGRTESVSAQTLGGGRHRSAAAFCAGGSPGERAALVVSQDRIATMFFNVGADGAGLGALGADVSSDRSFPSVFAVRVEQVGRGFATHE
jgi:CBS domain-containing protein